MKKALSRTFSFITIFLLILMYSVFFSNVKSESISLYSSTSIYEEAEDWELTGCSVGTYGSGYTGDGYVEFINQIGDGIKITTDDGYGYLTLLIHYSQGESTDQTLSLFVNSKFVQKINFQPTGTWDTTWDDATAFMYLPHGTNDIELKYTNGDGNVDIDYIVAYQSSYHPEEKMVIVPHEDDEIFAFCGSIQNMVENHHNVKVVLMTNGDFYGVSTGKIRIMETVNALAHVGVPKENVLVLGYGDATIKQLFDNESNIACNGNTQTYGNAENNVYDYHTIQTGVPASYIRSNLFNDLKNIISVNMPTEIFTTSYYDTHLDHSATYEFIEEVINDIRTEQDYTPLLHESIVHSVTDWPVQYSSYNPAPTPVPFTNPFPDNNKPLYWANATKIQLTNSMLNNKYAAIGEYVSQMVWDDYNYSFYKSDEFYWTRNYANIAPYSTVTQSSQNTDTGQVADNVKDWYVAGYDMHSDLYCHEWVTQNQTIGAWIKLNFSQSYSVNKIILNDRITTVDNIVSARLDFSDGSSITVSDIPANGTDCVVTFDTKKITWVKLTVLDAEGYNVGLTEFQVIKV